MNASLPYKAFKKEGWANARCDLLKITGIGKTKRSAVRSLKEQVVLLFQGAIEDKTFEKLLRDSGFEPSTLAGVSVWETEKRILKKYAGQEKVDFTATLKPKIEMPDEEMPRGEYRKLDPFIITATSSLSHGGGISAKMGT